MTDDVILTDSDGRPFERPRPEDFATTTEWLRAYWRYKDAVAASANKAFAEQFRASMRTTARQLERGRRR